MPDLTLLQKDQFKATFVDPMRRVGEDDDYEAVPLRDYVTDCITDLGLATTLEEIEIQHVCVNGDNTYAHVMLYFGEPNRYLVIVTDNQNRTVYGHHVLDLTQEYGITNMEEAE